MGGKGELHKSGMVKMRQADRLYLISLVPRLLILTPESTISGSYMLAGQKEDFMDNKLDRESRQQA